MWILLYFVRQGIRSHLSYDVAPLQKIISTYLWDIVKKGTIGTRGETIRRG